MWSQHHAVPIQLINSDACKSDQNFPTFAHWSLRVIRCINIIMLTATMVFCIYVHLAYLRPLGISKTLILLFYLLSYTTLVGCLEQVIANLITPDCIMYAKDERDLSIAEIGDITSNFAFILFGFLYIATMIQIALSVRVMQGKNSLSWSKNMMRAIYALMLMATLAIVVSAAIIIPNNNYTHNYFDPLYAITFLVMSILYCIVFTILTRTISSLDGVGLKNEKASITKQFAFFFLSFISRTLYYAGVYYVQDKDVLNEDLDHDATARLVVMFI